MHYEAMSDAVLEDLLRNRAAMRRLKLVIEPVDDAVWDASFRDFSLGLTSRGIVVLGAQAETRHAALVFLAHNDDIARETGF